MNARRRLRILTWQVHGNYLWNLSAAPHDFVLVTKPGHPPHYAGRTRSFPWGDNVHEIAPQDVRRADFDLVLYQHRAQWEGDRLNLLSDAQRRLPCIYVEHDPPLEHPVDQVHWAQAADRLIHVTHFNRLMWDSGDAEVRVIEHGVRVPEDARWSGERARGLAVVNHLVQRGRRLGADVYAQLSEQVPLSLVGMDAGCAPGGEGEIPNMQLPYFMARHRFLFNPIRWTSLGLAVIEAMTIGLPVVGLATTELATVIVNGENGWLESDPQKLVPVMRRLIDDTELARAWSAGARATALARFGIRRFVADWDALFRELAGAPRTRREVTEEIAT